LSYLPVIKLEVVSQRSQTCSMHFVAFENIICSDLFGHTSSNKHCLMNSQQHLKYLSLTTCIGLMCDTWLYITRIDVH